MQGLAEALGEKPLCGGCGAKLAPGALTTALAGLPEPARSDVLSGRGDDAAVLRWGDGVQVMTTDHLRAFTADARLMARIAAIHALGDVWAMGAAPQVALAQVVLPRMAAEMAADELAEVMDEAAAVFAMAGADVVGGHSSVGAELTIGFTVTGLAPRAVGKGGALPGDALILTKALGTGTVMAAEMAMARLPGLTILGEAVALVLARSACQAAGAGAGATGPCDDRCNRLWPCGASAGDAGGIRFGRTAGGGCNSGLAGGPRAGGRGEHRRLPPGTVRRRWGGW